MSKLYLARAFEAQEGQGLNSTLPGGSFNSTFLILSSELTPDSFSEMVATNL